MARTSIAVNCEYTEVCNIAHQASSYMTLSGSGHKRLLTDFPPDLPRLCFRDASLL
jgi:hypothetical protein